MEKIKEKNVIEMLKEYHFGEEKKDKSINKTLVVPIGVRITPALQNKINKYYSKINESKERSQRRQEARELSTNNAIEQIRRSIENWTDDETPSGRSKMSKVLEKLLKPIREPKYGYTLNALAGCFYPEDFDFEWIESRDNSDAQMKMRNLIQRLKKRKPEGLKLVAIKFKDPLLDIIEYRYVNGFWNDSLIDTKEIHKKKVLEGLERVHRRALKTLSKSKQERHEGINEIFREMDRGSQEAEKILQDVDNYKNLEWWRIGYQQSEMWRDRFMGKVPYNERPKRIRAEQATEELGKSYRLVNLPINEHE